MTGEGLRDAARAAAPLLSALLAVAGVACGGAARPGEAAASPAPPGAATSPPTMAVAQPSVRPLELAGGPPGPAISYETNAPAPVHVRIPAIGVDAGVLRLGLAPDGTIEVPPDFSQAGWYTKGPAPGEPGPAVILGHLDSYTGPAVFARLSSLRPGAAVLISRADGSQVRFVVQRVATFPVDSFPTGQVYGATTEPSLRLITCGGSFSLSQRRYLANVVAFATVAS